MENLKIPIALVVAMAAQFGAGVWWVSQQALIISDLEGTVAQMSSRMAIEDQVNLKRDVQSNAEHLNAMQQSFTRELDDVWQDIDDAWVEINSMASHMTSIMQLQQRIAVIGYRLTQIIFHLAHLVAAKCQPVAIVSFDQKTLNPKFFRQIELRFQRRGREPQPRPGNFCQVFQCQFSGPL